MTLFNSIKIVAFTFFTVLCTHAFALDLDAMTDQQKDQFGEQVHEYLLNNPEVIIEAYNVYEERKRIAESREEAILVSSYLDEIQNDGFSWVGGNPDGDITLVEFLDYKCGYCRKAHEEVASLVETDGNIRLVVKEYPILGEDSVILSRAAVSTLQNLGPDAYKKMYNQFITHDGPVTLEAIAFLAKKVDLDGHAILAQIDSQSVQDQINKTRTLGEKLNVNGTPTFVFNDHIVRGYIQPNQMQQIVAELRAQNQ